jgi:NhaP-type Na+/H+ or K+/H+ antiporter
MNWSPSVTGILLIILIIGRILAIMVTQCLFSRCSKPKNDIKLNEILYLTFGGMMRGAICFGLVLRLPSFNREIIGKDETI